MVLASGRLRLELTTPATGVFRFRANQRGARSVPPSWAATAVGARGVPGGVVRRAGSVKLSNPSGALEVGLESGRLRLYGPDMSVLLQSARNGCGCGGRGGELRFELSGDEILLGMGESSGPFNRAGLIQKFWNTDALGHGGIHPGLRNLYVSVPFTVVLRQGRAFGLFWDNPARQEWDLGQTDRGCWRLQAASGAMDLHLFTGPDVPTVVERYTALTGRMPMPPRWALGYHQCRYSYESREALESVADELRRRRIPCDALYLDIHHMEGYRVFTFGRTFPRPAEMIARLRRRGFRTVAIVDPGVKVDPAFGVYRRGRKLGMYVRGPDGKRPYVGKVWPGRSVFPDFLNSRVRRWWGTEQARLQRIGVGGFWNDMNEPANFVAPTKTLPERCRHESDAGPVRHGEVHNVYGMQMARASREGALRHRPDERPFVITRAAYAGTQRHAMVWTGDNASSWEQMADSVQMLLNLGLSGFPFCGGDAGGFLDNCTPELYARWMQMAAFTPFFRNHTMTGTLAHEPWTFGRRTETIVRGVIELRYRLLPYWYALFAEAHRTGGPIMRPLLWDHQDDAVAAACGDQFMVGSALLVAPVLQQGAVARSVYLPRGEWFDFWSGRVYRGGRHIIAAAPLHRLPLYVRAGSIVPMGPARQHTGGAPVPVIDLHLWPRGSSGLEWYEDDGCTERHARGVFHRRGIWWDSRRLRFEPAQGSFDSRVRSWRVLLHGAPRRTRVAGSTRPVRLAPSKAAALFRVRNRGAAFERTLR